jgi:SAM-dependent methyltransferase
MRRRKRKRASQEEVVLNLAAMLDMAAEVGTSRPVQWRQADAMQLPFEGGVFDAVVCQFGVMFFPERSRAYSEARRVLRSGGVFMQRTRGGRWPRSGSGAPRASASTPSRSISRPASSDPCRYGASACCSFLL